MPDLRLGMLLGILLLLLGALSAAQSDRTIVVARAATLTEPFDQLARQLPQWKTAQESGGSVFLLRKVVDLRPRMDVLAVADASLLRQLAAEPSRNRGLIRWWVIFARNELVLAYTPKSHHAGEITAQNWYRILQRSDVASGYANPNLDPEGYNTLLAWKLAERYYHQPGLYQRLKAAVPARNLRDHSVALLALLEAGELDYAWEYLSVARQHNLRYLQLPPEINLGDPSRKAEYEQVSVDLTSSSQSLPPGEPGMVVRGEPIEYAVTIPSTAEDVTGAKEFLRVLLSPAGRKLLDDSGQPAVSPAIVEGERSAAPPEVLEWTSPSR